MSDRPLTTHSLDCWSWGPKHYECAVRRVKRLKEALRLIESAKARGFGIDYARGVAQSALLHDQEAWHRAPLLHDLEEGHEQ